MIATQNGAERILIIRISSAGDIILASPLVRMLRARFPDATIDMVTAREFILLVENAPYLNNVIALERSWGLRELVTFARGVVRSTGRYDVVVDIHGSLRSRVLRRLLGRSVVRIRKPTLRKGLLVWTGRNRLRPIVPIPLLYLEVVRGLDVVDDGLGLEVFIGDTTCPIAVDPHRKTWILAPGARHLTKAWPRERFARLASLLASQDTRVILLGGPEERALCDEIALTSGAPHMIVNLAGRTSFLEAASVIDQADIVVANDSALAHMAIARQKPTIVLFGSTVQEFGFAPFRGNGIVVERTDVECRPCSTIGREACPRGHFNCMRKIDVKDVMAAAARLQKQ